MALLIRRPLSDLGLTSILALIGLVVLVCVSVLAPWLLGTAANQMDVLAMGQGPSAQHWLGTDNLGRDILVRTLVATRLSLTLALLATLMSVAIGVPIGILLASAPAIIRTGGARVIDAMLAFPGILLALVVTAIVGPSATGAVLAVGIANVPTFARLSLVLASSTMGQDYVQSARAVGLSRSQLLLRHILPNVGDTLIIAIATNLGLSIVTIASLSFLGLGVTPPDYDWGGMLIEGVRAIYVTPLAAIAPAFGIAMAGMVAAYAGEAVAQLLNPRRRHRRMASASELPAQAPALAEAANGDDAAALEARELRVSFPGRDRWHQVVRGVDITVRRGEVVGIVGESGSGKSLTALAISSLLPYPAQMRAAAHRIAGRNPDAMPREEKDRHLAENLAMVFQNPMSSLNPAIRIGTQLSEAVRRHRGLDRLAAEALAVETLKELQVTAPQLRLRQYPHELSGGMRQRIMIAMALMINPRVIVADEPTTALDVTVQREILKLFKSINERHGTAIILISHDLGVISQVCDRTMVMYAGRVVEEGPTERLLRDPRHPYTRSLLASVPHIEHGPERVLRAIDGTPPAFDAMPAGCSFAPRCPDALERCRATDQHLAPAGATGRVACWRHDDLALEVTA
jgi:peptide/nickel transport system permease protein